MSAKQVTQEISSSPIVQNICIMTIFDTVASEKYQVYYSN